MPKFNIGDRVRVRRNTPDHVAVNTDKVYTIEDVREVSERANIHVYYIGCGVELAGYHLERAQDPIRLSYTLKSL